MFEHERETKKTWIKLGNFLTEILQAEEKRDNKTEFNSYLFIWFKWHKKHISKCIQFWRIIDAIAIGTHVNLLTITEISSEIGIEWKQKHSKMLPWTKKRKLFCVFSSLKSCKFMYVNTKIRNCTNPNMHRGKFIINWKKFAISIFRVCESAPSIHIESFQLNWVFACVAVCGILLICFIRSVFQKFCDDCLGTVMQHTFTNTVLFLCFYFFSLVDYM